MKEGLWPLVLVFAVGAGAYLYLQYFAELPIPLAQAPPSEAARLMQPRGLEMASISVPAAAIIGEPVQVYASLGACPPEGLGLFVDGNEVEYELDMGQRTLGAKIIARQGGNTIELKGKSPACSASYRIAPKARECSEGQNSTCTLDNGCAGVRRCMGGEYGPCISLPAICRPGKRATCAVNSCSEGYSQCNSCGTAWGPCTLE